MTSILFTALFILYQGQNLMRNSTIILLEQNRASRLHNASDRGHVTIISKGSLWCLFFFTPGGLPDRIGNMIKS